MHDGRRICVVGSGYVGTVVAACFASVGHEVTAFEIDSTKLESLEAGTPPLYEPGLGQILRDQIASGRLRFTDDPAIAVPDAGVVFICVGTPTTPTGHPEMGAVASAARVIAEHLTPDHVLVTKSTVPIGSAQWLEAILENANPDGSRNGGTNSIVSNPEFLREGSAVQDFLYPERIVLGGDDPEALDLVAEIYQPFIDQSFEGGRHDIQPEVVRTDLATAETIKYAANAFLATKISFINEVAALCERVGADVVDVADAIGLDSRIGPAFLNAGVGWGGSCFGKDLAALSATARDYGLEPLILDAVQKVNRRQRHIVVEKLQDHLQSLRGRKVALLGLSFKPGTDDLRDAPSVDIARRLITLGAVVSGYDPVVKDVPEVPELIIAGDPYDAAEKADAVVLTTEWPEFAKLELEELAQVMQGEFVLDGRNFLDPEKVGAAGLSYAGMGRGRRSQLPAPQLESK